MKVDNAFAGKVAKLAAEMVADGWPYGTFDKPDWILNPGASVESAMMRAAFAVWGGPGWWRQNMMMANQCLQNIRWIVCDDVDPEKFFATESEARLRWKSLTVDEAVIMLLFASQWLITAKASRKNTESKISDS